MEQWRGGTSSGRELLVVTDQQEGLIDNCLISGVDPSKDTLGKIGHWQAKLSTEEYNEGEGSKR